MLKLSAVPVLCAALLLSAPAAAHATVKTEGGLSESAAGKAESYRLNIPVEKAVATTEVRMVVPEGLSISRFQSMPGFVRTVSKNAAGLITEVVWKGRIEPLEYARFYFQARNPQRAGDIAWKVYQTYADGSVVAWDDLSEGAATPASKVTLK